MAAEDRATPVERSQLRDLVRERRATLGLSYEKLADRCIDPKSQERPVKSSWLHRLETGEKVQPPDISQLRAMAAGLQVRLEVVQDAAGAQFFGIDVVRSGSGPARALVERADRMTDEQLQQLLRLLDSFAPPE
ncbi:multiprotein-bridging factor 1 family protein [Streptomyces niveus]|uniref:helix-turn-helix domain-containing protein n=1 Tax=Streptomyces niveus TaxID=193462 RepID=UPI00341B05B2